MPSGFSARPHSARSIYGGVLVIFSAVLLLLGLATPAQARPSQPTVGSVTAQLSKLARDSERLSEAYNKAVIDVTARERELARAMSTARATASSYRKSQAAVRAMIQQQYKNGDASSTSEVLLSATSTQNLVDRMALVSVVSAHRIAVAKGLHTDRIRAQAAAATMRRLLGKANRQRADLAATRAILRSQVKKYSSLLTELKAAQRQKMLQIRAAKAKALAAAATAAKKKRTQITAVAQPAKKRTAAAPRAKPTNKRKVPTRTVSPAPAPSARAAIAVKFALAQLGKPYVFAASGPNAYDCSGLTMAAWAAAGVSLPHFSAWQYDKGHHVSRSQLQPGDLVFFYHPISHVGMYIGHGRIVHAPHTGDVVRIAPLSNWSSSDYVGATRL